MRSVNHQFLDFQDKVYARYKKGVNCVIAGWRQDPYKGGYNRLEWVLKSQWDNFSYENKVLTFNYDDDVIEIYSPEEDKVFRQLNVTAIKTGLLVPYDGVREEEDFSSVLSDEALSELAAIKTILQFKKRISEINNKPTLQRLLKLIETADRPISFIRAAEERIREL